MVVAEEDAVVEVDAVAAGEVKQCRRYLSLMTSAVIRARAICTSNPLWYRPNRFALFHDVG